MTKLLLKVRFCQGSNSLCADFQCEVDAWEDCEQEKTVKYIAYSD